MIIQIFTEPAFEESSWCIAIMEGLVKALSKKKLAFEKVSEIPQDIQKDEPHFLIIIASDEKWLTAAIARCRDSRIHPVVLSSHIRQTMPGAYSSVTSDIRQSVYYLINHLKKKGRVHPAIYGVNPASVTDISRKNSFLEFAEGSAGEEDIYYNNGSLQGCFDNFEGRYDKYDCVICVNDYAAISLIKNLERVGCPDNKILPVSYGGTVLSSAFADKLFTISLCYDEYGKAAVSICETLNKNPALLYINVAVKWKIVSSDEITVTELPNDPHLPDSAETMKADELFYSDAEMCSMILVENMLSACDKVDFELLSVLLSGGSYELAAEKCFISHNTVKYRLKKLMDICGSKTKKDFLDFVKSYYSK